MLAASGDLNLPHLHRWMRFSQLGYAAEGEVDLILAKQMIARPIFGKRGSCAVARRDTGTTRSGDPFAIRENRRFGVGLGHVAPVEDDLAGVARAHGGEAFFVVAPVHP